MAVMVLTSASAPSLANAQPIAGNILSQGKILLRNPTDRPITFQVQSANTDWTQFTLGPGESSTYSAAGDRWMNVQVSSDGGNHTYGLDVGQRAYFQWVGNDLQLVNLGQ
jgi:hypothetical protein